VFGLSKRALIVIAVLIVVVAIFVVQNKGKSNAQSTGDCKVQVTATELNVREAADGNAKVAGKLVSGNTVNATTTVQNGYRELGQGRWASNQFLKQVSGKC
jgi:uncharacterized protein YgiM (DUF1202 family)